MFDHFTTISSHFLTPTFISFTKLKIRWSFWGAELIIGSKVMTQNATQAKKSRSFIVGVSFRLSSYYSLMVTLKSTFCWSCRDFLSDLTVFVLSLMSGSCHLDRASNVEIGVECQIFVIVKLQPRFTILGTFKV